MQPLSRRDAMRRVGSGLQGAKIEFAKLTELGDLLLVRLVGDDGVLGRLGLLDSLLDGDEPAVALSSGLGLEGVLAAVQLEVEGNGTVLGELGGIGLRELVDDGEMAVGMLTSFKAPAGVDFSSACLTKKSRPLPVTLDQAAVGWATSAFSPRR